MNVYRLMKSQAMTYHFVNAASDNDQVQETVEITEFISGIIDIIHGTE